ncbi:MAG: hypothetical protein ABI218_13285 [Caldimonas sp.]
MHTSTPLSESIEASSRPVPPATSRSMVFFSLLCAFAFASSVLSVAAEADESPIAIALSALP